MLTEKKLVNAQLIIAFLDSKDFESVAEAMSTLILAAATLGLLGRTQAGLEQEGAAMQFANIAYVNYKALERAQDALGKEATEELMKGLFK
jgi:hypothetical protein